MGTNAYEHTCNGWLVSFLSGSRHLGSCVVRTVNPGDAVRTATGVAEHFFWQDLEPTVPIETRVEFHIPMFPIAEDDPGGVLAIYQCQDCRHVWLSESVSMIAFRIPTALAAGVRTLRRNAGLRSFAATTQAPRHGCGSRAPRARSIRPPVTRWSSPLATFPSNGGRGWRRMALGGAACPVWRTLRRSGSSRPSREGCDPPHR